MIEVSQGGLSHSKAIFTGKSALSAFWTLTIAIVGFLAFMGWAQSAAALLNTPNENTYVTNGTVWAIADNGTTIIIGGDFTYAGPNTGHGVPIFVPGGALVSVYPRVNGDVYAVVPDGSGGWFIGGDFTDVGGQVRNNIAHINPNGNVDTGWVTNTNAPVRAMVLSGGLLYAGGDFTSIKNHSRGFVAAINASNCSLNDWDPGADNIVRSLAVGSGLVYIGGDFNSVGGVDNTARLAAVDATTGAVASWYPMLSGPLGLTVYALVVNGTTVYAGGNFTGVGSDTRNRIAAIDASTGLATSWNPNTSGAVYALLVNGTTVYAGGAFSTIGGSTRHRIAAIDANTGLPTSWNPNANDVVNALVLSGTTIYAGGAFSNIGGQARNYLAGLNAAGAATSWNPNASGLINTPSGVNALALSGSKVYAGGSFISVGGQERLHLAALNASDGSLNTNYKPNPDGTVHALALSSTTLYVGGDFSSIGGQSRRRLASFDRETGNINTWNPECDSNTIFALAVSADGATVYAGGSFEHIGGQPRNYIAALDSTGSATSWDPNAEGSVLALALSGSKIYAGGQFFNIGAQAPDPPRSFLASLDVATGDATSWNPVPDGYVYALALNGPTVYVGGEFFSFGPEMEVERDHMAALDINTGNPTAWDPSADNTVWALAVSGGQVYAGGDFDLFKEINSRPFLASLDAGTGNLTSWTPNADLTVYALAVRPGRLYVGGAFSFMGDRSQPCFAQFSSTYLISGKVTSGGSGLSGVTVNLTGATMMSITADNSGNYTFSGLSDGIYTITPGYTGYTFTPPSIDVNISGANVTGQDFTATLTTYSISGRVTRGGVGLAGAAVNLTGAATLSTITDGNGNYSFSGLSNGAYTMTPSKVGYTFTPPSISNVNINGANVTGQDFTATLTTYSISGRVTSGGVGFAGAAVNLTGAATLSTITDGNGNYSFSGLSNGAYTMTPSKVGYTFTPPSINNVNINGANVAGQDFTATLITYSISGTVRSGGVGFAGAAMNLTGAATLSTITDGNGNYSFPGLSNGAYTITPSKVGYTFTPLSINVSITGANVTGQNFSAPLGAATLVSPSGTNVVNQPTYIWNAVANSDYYLLAVGDSTGSWPVYTWYSKTDVRCGSGGGNCTITPEVTLACGNGVWYVQTWNTHGLGPWCQGRAFDVGSGPPDEPNLVFPKDTIDRHKPAFTWKALANAEYYQLAVQDATGWPLDNWYSKADVHCGTGDGNCTITPDVVLANSDYTWYVQAWNTCGLGLWSDGMPFKVAGLNPGTPTPVSPKGTIGMNHPTYIWKALANAEYYLLATNDSTGSWPVYTWYSKVDAGCGNGDGNCTVTPAATLASGDCNWYVQAWNYSGIGPWSDGMAFTTLGKASLNSPTGTINTHQPTYAWNAVNNADYYLLAAEDSTGSWPVYIWYSKADAGCSTGTGTCSATPSGALTSGNYSWYTRTWNVYGYGAWSEKKDFTVQ